MNVTLNPQQGALYFWPGFNDPRNGFDTPAEYMDGLHAIYIKGSLRQISMSVLGQGSREVFTFFHAFVTGGKGAMVGAQ